MKYSYLNSLLQDIYRELHNDLVKKLSKDGLNELCTWKGINLHGLKKKHDLAHAFLEAVLPDLHKEYSSYGDESPSEMKDLDFVPNNNRTSNTTEQLWSKKRKGTSDSSCGPSTIYRCDSQRKPNHIRKFKSHRACPTLTHVQLSEFTDSIDGGK